MLKLIEHKEIPVAAAQNFSLADGARFPLHSTAAKLAEPSSSALSTKLDTGVDRFPRR